MRIGIDVGGTKIEAIALGDEGEERGRRRMPTPCSGTVDERYAALLEVIASLVGDLEQSHHRQATVGIGMPGTLSPASGVVKNANTTWLNGRPFDRDLSVRLDRPVRLANDANCFAVSEAIDGAAAGASVVFGVILGTGVGGGLVIDGRPWRGVNAIAGEWGHNPLPWPSAEEWPGPACYCGKTGCIETFLSGPGLAADHERHGGGKHGVPAIVALADMGAPAALAALDRYADRLSRALAGVINIVDPDVIVLGGGLSHITRLYADVPGRWRDWVFSDHVATSLRRARHGDSSGVRGAAWLWPPASSAPDNEATA